MYMRVCVYIYLLINLKVTIYILYYSLNIGLFVFYGCLFNIQCKIVQPPLLEFNNEARCENDVDIEVSGDWGNKINDNVVDVGGKKNKEVDVGAYTSGYSSFEDE